MRTNHKEQGADVRPSPSGLAEALKLSVDRDVAQRVIDPQSDEDVHEVAHWASESRYFEPEIRAWATLEPHQSVSFNLTKSWLRDRVSPHPERFREVVETCQILQLRFLKAQTERLESCGKVWWSQYVVRVFWRDWRGRERLRRQIGVHRCKHAWCPVCSRTRQAKLSQEIEKCLILASDLGLHDGHARLVTLTIPNGKDIYELIEQAHTAFAKLQRTRWWNRQVFGWVRGSEIVTGRDGNWNVHIHLLVLFWSQWVSYATLSEKWTEELGGPRGNGRKYIVDCETLCALQSKRKKGGPRPLKRKNSIARAARYITKYLSKPEELRSLCSGPGGLAHLVSATKGLRRFSVGAGCSVLRKAAHVLLPNRIYQAEEALAETYLHQGRPPCRVNTSIRTQVR